MATLITANDGTADTTAPDALRGYKATRESQNVIHDIIGGGIAVTLVRPRPRSGDLVFVYELEADAAAALALLSRETTFSLTNTDRASVAMDFVTKGVLSIDLDEGTLAFWAVTFGYQEIEL